MPKNQNQTKLNLIITSLVAWSHSKELFQVRRKYIFDYISVLCAMLSHLVMPNSLRPNGLHPPDSSAHEILQARILEWVAMPSSKGSSQPRDRTQAYHFARGFFTIWATGKLKNSGVGNLSLLQGIFLTQQSNQGLLHCRWILYQLSYQGSPGI